MMSLRGLGNLGSGGGCFSDGPLPFYENFGALV